MHIGAALGEQAVEVQHAGGAGTLVQVVDVLGNDAHVEALLEAHQLAVGLVGLGGEELAAALVVEVEHQGGVALVGFVGGHVLHAVALPEAVAVAEGGDSALGADARAGEYDYAFHTLINGIRK